MYNVNDFWFAQWNHLASTHEVVQITYLAAMRALCDEHPVLALLNRIMREVYAIQPLAETLLFLPGAAVDQVIACTGTSAQDYTTIIYLTGGSGRFQANYFTTNLESRGLTNSDIGPAVTNFPFFEDASNIYSAVHASITVFADSFYLTDLDIPVDREMHASVEEAQGPAQAVDFPSIPTKSALFDVLSLTQTHLVSTSHHTVNTNELLSASSTLHSHTPSLFQPPPVSKSSTHASLNTVDFLPPLAKMEVYLGMAAFFVRPFFVGTNRTLMHKFEDHTMLGRMCHSVGGNCFLQ